MESSPSLSLKLHFLSAITVLEISLLSIRSHVLKYGPDLITTGIRNKPGLEASVVSNGILSTLFNSQFFLLYLLQRSVINRMVM